MTEYIQHAIERIDFRMELTRDIGTEASSTIINLIRSAAQGGNYTPENVHLYGVKLLHEAKAAREEEPSTPQPKEP